MQQDRPQDLRPASLNCNLTEGIKIAKEAFVNLKEDYQLVREAQTK